MSTSTKDWKPRRITSEDDRSGGSTDYISLNHETAPHFVGYPLFVGDPAEPEPGYYEYMEHWLNDVRKRVVCPGEDVCPYCHDGDRPKTRAKTLWLVTEDEKGNVIVNAAGEPEPKLKIMSFNYNLIKMFTGFRKAGDKYVGRLMRVTLTDDRGNYSIFPKDDTLTKTAFKEALKSPNAPDFDELVTAQLRKAFEGYELSAAMEQADNGAEPAAPASAAKGKAAPEPDLPDDEPAAQDWPDDAKNLIVIVEEIADDGNWFEASHSDYDGTRKVWTTNDIALDFADLAPAMALAITGSLDSDGEYILSAEPEIVEAEQGGGDAPDEETPELPAKIADVKATVTGDVDTDNFTIPVSVEELGVEFLLYVLEGTTIDWADYKVGTEITIVEATRDSVGDLCTKTAPTVGGASGAKGKGGPKKAAAPAGKGKG